MSGAVGSAAVECQHTLSGTPYYRIPTSNLDVMQCVYRPVLQYSTTGHAVAVVLLVRVRVRVLFVLF